ncbi:MAG: LptF/LptG family permease [Pirellulales bacterium]
MKRLTRYVLFEMLAVFLITLLAMTVLMVLVGIVRQAVREGMGVGPVLKMIPFALPEALRFSVPATILLAACTVFGRMAADNEIVAIKSLGISPRVLFVPVLVLGLMMSIVAVWLNDMAVTWGREGIYRVAMESLEQIVYGVLRTQKSYITKRLSIVVKGVDGHRLVEPFISIYPNDSEEPITISARFAELTGDAQQGILRITLQNGVLQHGEYTYEFNESHEFKVPLTDVHRKGGPVKRASDVALNQLGDQRRLEQNQLLALQQRMAETAAIQLATGGLDQISGPLWDEQLTQWNSGADRLNRLTVEPWRRWANGFSCYFFVFVGAPLAVKMRTTNFFTTFAACFLPILFIYYPLMTYTVDQAKDGLVPACGVWAGNLVLAGVGSWLMRDVMRH